MGTVGDALDNAMCESLLGTMKIEKLDRQPWHSVEDVRAAVFDYESQHYDGHLITNPQPVHRSGGTSPRNGAQGVLGHERGSCPSLAARARAALAPPALPTFSNRDSGDHERSDRIEPPPAKEGVAEQAE